MKNIKISGLSVDETYEIIPERTILLSYAGSTAHGTKISQDDPNCIDDEDILGVCIAPENNYFGLGHFEQKEVKQGKWDSVVYEIRKMFRLLLQQNPNVMGLLWMKPKDYIHISDSGQLLLDNRNIFVSKQAFFSFNGYAHSQLYRMTHGACEGYMGAKRKALVEKFGFDCKNAAHLIRLLRMGIEFLTDGQLQVFRKDNDQLKEIKRGEWKIEQVMSEADRLFKLAEEAYVRSSLPTVPNKDEAELLLLSILRDHFIS